MNKKTIHIVLLVAIVLFGFLLRLHGVDRHIAFTDDAGEYFLRLRDIVTGQLHETISGPGSSVLYGTDRFALSPYGFKHGKFLGLLLASVMQVASFQPVGMIYVWIGVDLLTILAVYWAGRALDPRAGLIAAFLFAIGHWQIYFSRVPFGFVLIGFIVALSMGSFIRMLKGEERFWPLFILTLTLFPHIHNVGYMYSVFAVASLLLWRISLPRSVGVRLLTCFSFIPLSFLFVWDSHTIFSLLQWGSDGRTMWRSSIEILLSAPQALFQFVGITLVGYPIVQLIVSPVAWIAGILGVLVAWVGMGKGSSFFQLQKMVYLRGIVWLGVIVLLFVLCSSWFYRLSIARGYILPSYLIPIIALYIGISGLLSYVMVKRRMAAWIIVLIFFIGLASGSATEQIIWKDRFAMLGFAVKQDILQVIDADSATPATVCVMPQGGEHVENFIYIWRVGTFHREVNFVSSCNEDSPTGSMRYGIFPPGKDWSEYIRGGRVVYGSHASYLVVAYE